MENYKPEKSTNFQHSDEAPSSDRPPPLSKDNPSSIKTAPPIKDIPQSTSSFSPNVNKKTSDNFSDSIHTKPAPTDDDVVDDEIDRLKEPPVEDHYKYSQQSTHDAENNEFAT